MKIICTKKEQRNLQETFNRWVDIPKVWGYCPFAYIYCPHTPLGDIEPEQCRECLKKHLEWEITEDNSKVQRKKKPVDPRSCSNCWANNRGICDNEGSTFYKMPIEEVKKMQKEKRCDMYGTYEGDG